MEEERLWTEEMDLRLFLRMCAAVEEEGGKEMATVAGRLRPVMEERRTSCGKVKFNFIIILSVVIMYCTQ